MTAAGAGAAPALKNQAQAYPARGVCVRQLDHVNPPGGLAGDAG